MKKYKRFKGGGKVSLQGYKEGSPDRFNDYNIIPSNSITMRGVPHPVLGVDDTGARRMMYPGFDYTFPGKRVLEVPVPLMDRRVPVLQQGGSGPIIPIVAEEEPAPFEDPNGADMSRLIYLTDLTNHAVATGENPFSNTQGKILFNTESKLPGSDASVRKLFDSISIFQQRNDVKKMSPEERVRLYYTLFNDDPAVETFKKKAKTLGYGPVNFFRGSPDVATRTLLNNPLTGLQAAVPKKLQTGGEEVRWLPNIPAAQGVLSGMSFLGNALEAGDRNRYKEWQRQLMLGAGPMVTGSRGDYSMNEGYFQPQSYVPVQFGAIPMAQAGGFFSDPLRAPVLEMPPQMYASVPAGRSVENYSPVDKGGNVERSLVLTKKEPNDRAWDAFNYYVEHKNLEPHVAAGIVGNLYQESALKPEVQEKGNTKQGRGIAQWNVDGRWKGLLDWADKNERDPYDVYAQLDYVLIEPGEGAKALKALAKTDNPIDAADTFRVVYERPSRDPKIGGNKTRAGIAQKLYDGFLQSQQGMAPSIRNGQLPYSVKGFESGGEYDRYLPKGQEGGVVDHYKQDMLNKYGKYLITDKGTNRTYYGYPGADGKLIENSFEVLTGKSRDNNYVVPYSLGEVEKMNQADQDKVKVTPVGSFALSYNPNLYGNPGLNIANTKGVAMHTTYDPAVRNAYYNNKNALDNYASYGCINCRKPDINNVLKGFGNNDRINIVDSRRSVDENINLGRDNDYLYNNPEAARMLFENSKSRVVRRKWNEERGVYEGEDSDYDPATDTIISKRELAPVTVSARKVSRGDVGVSVPKRVPEILTPLQKSLVGSSGFVNRGNISIVDYLNERGIDSSKANRMEIARSLGMDDYAYTAEDNISMLHRLQDMAQNNVKNLPQQMPRQMRDGGDVEGGQKYSLRRSIEPVRRGDANIEAERGETVMGDFDGDGINAHLTVGGKRHFEGGTPLNVPAGAFVFSDTKKMKIGGAALQHFGKGVNDKKKYTPAELAKQYDVNKYKSMLGDPTSDRMALETAQLMLENNETKLGKLAMVQEAMKGFPNGIPGIAMPYIQQFFGVTADAAMPEQVPVMQKGGQKGRQVYSPEMVANSFTGVDNQVTTFPSYLLKNNKPVFETMVPMVQSERKDGRFGQMDMSMQDFYARHPWVKEVNPGFDPANKSDVTWFQNEYNKRYESLLGRKYFDGTGHRKIDGMFGQGTFSTPAIKFTDPAAEVARVFPEPANDPSLYTYAVPTVPADVVDTQGPKPTTDDGKKNPPPKESMNWWTQDVLNTGAAFGNRYGLQKYMPTYVSPDVVLPEATFYDPTRQLAANQEQAAAQNMMASLYAGVQRQRAVGSNVQGQAAGNAANILGQVQNQNVGVANQFAGVRSDIMNKKSLADATARKTYMDELATVNQQYDNSKRLGNASVLANLNSGITNAQETYWLNKMNDQFTIDPRTGRLAFTRVKSLGASSGQQEVNDGELYNYYNKAFRAANPDLEKLEERAHEYAMKKIQERMKGNGASVGISDYRRGAR